MARRLDELIQQADPVRSLLSDRPEERVAFVAERARAARDPQTLITTRLLLGRELLAVGRTEEAIAAYQTLVDALAGRLAPQQESSLRRYLASAHLRRAEEDNCMATMSPRACLLPIGGSGVHSALDGTLAAVGELERALALDPAGLGLRWLLNVAQMNLGRHPDGVAEAWRIPISVFGSARGVNPFANLAPAAGVDVLGLSGGAVIEDLDGDGRLDIVASAWGLREPLRVFINRGADGFEETSDGAGLAGLTGGLNLIHADYDNDGDADLFVLRGAWLGDQGLYPNSLLRNRGDGSFEDVTESAGLLSFHPTQTAAWGDYDDDGFLDLFVGNESTAGSSHPCELYRNNGDGTFTENAMSVGLAHEGFVKGVAWGDYDNDGRLDLYLSQLGEENRLFRNAGGTGDGHRFVDTTDEAGVGEPLNSFPTWFWDYDNDGWLDLLVLPFPGFDGNSLDQIVGEYLGEPGDLELPRLYRNGGDGSFEERTGEAGLDHAMLAMGSNYGDLDNDGWLDVYVGTGEPDLATLVPNRMYRNAAGQSFENVTLAGGFGHLQKGHGIAWGDLDNDGDQDIYAVMGGAYPADTARNTLFLNPGSDHHWLSLDLVGKEANRSAIGARVRVRVRTVAGRRDVHATVGTGGSFGSSSLRLEMGLGEASSLESVEILWPGAPSPQTIDEMDMDSSYRIVQGESPQRLTRPDARITTGSWLSVDPHSPTP